EAHGAEWGTPVLYMRAPDGHIFDVAPVTQPVPPPMPAPSPQPLDIVTPSSSAPAPSPQPLEVAVGLLGSAPAPTPARAPTEPPIRDDLPPAGMIAPPPTGGQPLQLEAPEGAMNPES